jgi:hypothetical protein
VCRGFNFQTACHRDGNRFPPPSAKRRGGVGGGGCLSKTRCQRKKPTEAEVPAKVRAFKLALNLLKHPPPPTPPRHAQGRVGGGEITVHGFAISPQVFLREVCSLVRLSPKRGRRECRALDAPDSRVCNGCGRTHTRCQVTPESPGIPHAMVYGLYRALPGARALWPPSSAKVAFRELDTSVGVSGPRDFAVRVRCPRQKHYPRPPHPAPRL